MAISKNPYPHSLPVISAWLLYYLSSGDDIHGPASNLHAAVGFALPFVLPEHIVTALKTRKRRSAPGQS